MKTKIVALVLALGSFAHASQGPAHGIDTENNEIVCQMDDFLETKLFVDRDSTYDRAYGVYSTKVIEMPTANVPEYHYELFPVKVVSVKRYGCAECSDLQTILYRPTTPSEMIFKLEIQQAMNGQLRAVQTRNVDANGKPRSPSFVSYGVCEANEPY